MLDFSYVIISSMPCSCSVVYSVSWLIICLVMCSSLTCCLTCPLSYSTVHPVLMTGHLSIWQFTCFLTSWPCSRKPHDTMSHSVLIFNFTFSRFLPLQTRLKGIVLSFVHFGIKASFLILSENVECLRRHTYHNLHADD